MSGIHMHAPSSRPALGKDSGGVVVKAATFGAIVAIFGTGFYFIGGQSSQSPVGTPATASAAPPAASANADAGARGAAVQASVPQAAAAAGAAPAQAAAAQAPADRQLAQSAPPAEPAPAAVAAPAAAPADLADSSAPAPAAVPAPPHQAAHSKTLLASAQPAGQAADAAAAPARADAQPDAVSVLNPWWQGAEAQPFKITAVSPVKDQQALAVVFSEPVGSNAGEHLKLLNNDGSAAAGSWSQGANPHVLVRSGVAPGRYMLFVDGAVASSGGKSLGSDLSGPVYVLASR
jgi:hypothetical protein